MMFALLVKYKFIITCMFNFILYICPFSAAILLLNLKYGYTESLSLRGNTPLLSMSSISKINYTRIHICPVILLAPRLSVLFDCGFDCIILLPNLVEDAILCNLFPKIVPY